jgi:hypothetical protein
MPLLKKGKKNEEPASASPPVEAAAPATTDMAPPPPVADAPQPEAVAAPPPPPPPMPPARGGNGGARGGRLVGRLYGPPGEQSAAERQRIAEAEFQAAIAPALDLLVAAVPEAQSPQEAARALEARLGEYTPDPGPGAYVYGDAFDADARVYYRLLKRDYERNPRPSEKRQKSHHLHEKLGLLPGTRGW